MQPLHWLGRRTDTKHNKTHQTHVIVEEYNKQQQQCL